MSTAEVTRRGRGRFRTPIPVGKAIELYARLGRWRLVAAELKREDGTAFQPQAIASAVSWADKGNAGYRN